MVDFNAGFDKIFKEEDRTGEDYYGRVDREDYSFFRLFQRKILCRLPVTGPCSSSHSRRSLKTMNPCRD